jgi:F-type H+-transporting ATPase subunit epsilon
VDTLKLEIVTAERQLFSAEVRAVIAPGVEGQLGILPHHAPLMTMLQAGELVIKKEDEEDFLFISGGFLEVRPDKVIILADACEYCEEINISRAEEAKQRAEERLKMPPVTGMDHTRAEAALRRSLVRLKVAEKVRKKPRRNI